MYYVIGSGPSGVSCAYALVRRGLQVTLIDTGMEMESRRREQLLELQAVDPGKWWMGEGEFLRQGAHAGPSGIPLKLAYGSDFPYRAVPGATPVASIGAHVAASYAQGGFSNVWGAAVLPYRQRDIPDWPIGVERLRKHYASVFDFMPLAARHDGLAEEFPLYAHRYEALGMSRQAESMLRTMERSAARLHAKGVRFGAARIAVHARQNGRDCALCGLCMYGCPYQLIYSSSATLRQLREQPNFHYAPGWRAHRVEEVGGQAKISAFSVGGESACTFQGERVYLACGVLETTSLLLRSLGQYDRSVRLADSQYFLLPFLRFRGTPDVRRERLHTLAQIFLEIDDPAISPYTVHLQTYSYNDLFETALRTTFGPTMPMLPTGALLSRLLLFQGYLHSAHSAPIAIELRRNGSGKDILHVAASVQPRTRQILRSVAGKLLRLGGELGAMPLLPLLRTGAPGRGFHTGGSLPMREHPDELQTDVFGRPAGFNRVHAIDSSIFPSIPATTITLTAMANAHRIGDELDLYA